MRLSTLADWLKHIGCVHNKNIDLGLERVREVASRMGLLTFDCPVVVVGGTNGKGTTVAALASIYQQMGYVVGHFTSPFIIKHNEQVCINNIPISDDLFCDAYQSIENERGSLTLTPFEFHTLAALHVFKHSILDIMILEVGLGGRLDAVNVVDADVSIVTSVALDHEDWLGDTREEIGLEKAHIFRRDRFALCGDDSPPDSLLTYADEIGARLYLINRAFGFQEKEAGWDWVSPSVTYPSLPNTHFLKSNLSLALMAVTLLQNKLPVNQATIFEGIKNISLKARLEKIGHAIYDVSHNPAAVSVLAGYLKKPHQHKKTVAVFSMYQDKDIQSCIRNIKHDIDEWFVAPMQDERSATLSSLKKYFSDEEINCVSFYPTLKEAEISAKKQTNQHARIVYFGSFGLHRELYTRSDFIA